MENEYLNEALTGDYGNESEDRLTQIFSASFNSSELFRKAVCVFAGVRYKKSLLCLTQQAYYHDNEKSVLDLLIVNGETPVLIIENKVDAPLDSDQLEKYSKIPSLNSTKKLALTKSYQIENRCPKGWSINYWSDFHYYFNNLPERDFVQKNFITRLERLNMEKPKKIRREDIKRLAKAFHALRYTQKPHFRLDLPVFEVIEHYKSMVEEIQKKVVCDNFLMKRIGRKVRFNPWFSWWCDTDEKQKMPWVGWSSHLSKPYKGICNIGTALHFYKNPSKYSICAYIQDKEKNYIDTAEYPNKILIYEEYEKMVIEFWKKELK